MTLLTKIPSYMRFLPVSAKILPTIFKAYHFLTITPYCHFLAVMLLACLLILLFFRTFPCHTPPFCHNFLFWHNFLFCCASSFFFLPFTSFFTASFLFFLFYPCLFRNSFFFFFSSSPYLGRILSEFFLFIPRPNN